jgi:hypothetical protein
VKLEETVENSEISKNDTIIIDVLGLTNVPSLRKNGILLGNTCFVVECLFCRIEQAASDDQNEEWQGMAHRISQRFDSSDVATR